MGMGPGGREAAGHARAKSWDRGESAHRGGMSQERWRSPRGRPAAPAVTFKIRESTFWVLEKCRGGGGGRASAAWRCAGHRVTSWVPPQGGWGALGCRGGVGRLALPGVRNAVTNPSFPPREHHHPGRGKLS